MIFLINLYFYEIMFQLLINLNYLNKQKLSFLNLYKKYLHIKYDIIVERLIFNFFSFILLIKNAIFIPIIIKSNPNNDPFIIRYYLEVKFI